MKLFAQTNNEIKFALHVRQHISYPEGIFHSEAISLARRANFIEKEKPDAMHRVFFFWRRHPDLNRGIADLQSTALPLGYGAILERATRLELATSTLARWRSTG